MNPIADPTEAAPLLAPASEPELDPTPEPAPTTRRRLFGLGAAMVASVLVPGRPAEAQRVARPLTRRPSAPPAPGDSLVRLVRRATNGVTQEELNRARSLGFRGYLEYQLRPDAIEDTAVEQFVQTNFPLLRQPGSALYQMDQGQIFRQLQDATLYRAAFSRRQLYERMVHFWTDHFNISWRKVTYLQVADDRDVIRKHALGRFPELLRASAHSGAMLEYLDNTRSRGRNVNQNYARELMELHTMGSEGGYTQKDVEEVTRCLTGWTIAGRGGDFRFDPAGHDFTAKVVLGNNIPAMAASAGAAGIQDGEKVLEILLAHPSTAKFISWKMVRWLLRYDPPAALVDRVAATFTKTGGDIPAMIRVILTPENLLAAPAKYKQPYQLVSSGLRAVMPSVRTLGPMRGQLNTLGQPLHAWEEPDGYPDEVDWWAGLILQRWNFCSFLTGLASGDMTVDVSSLMAVPTPAAIAAAIGQRAFAGGMPAALEQDLVAHLSAAPISATRVREAFALALGSNAFQWY